jgi:tRNA1Val (adenine37-N6)-methyltransferase
MRDVSRLLPEKAFDLVVSNPPFYPINTGRLSPNAGRAVARHELNGTFLDFARGARHLLKDTGRFVIIHRADMAESLLKDLSRSGLHAAWIQYVHSNSNSPPWRVLIEAKPDKERQMIIRPRLNLRQNGVYTPSIQALIDGDPQLAFKEWENRCSS